MIIFFLTVGIAPNMYETTKAASQIMIFSSKVVVTALLSTIAIVIAFGPEIRRGIAQLRRAEAVDSGDESAA